MPTTDAIEIPYQLYSSRNFPDIARQAAMLAHIGFRAVEPFDGQFTDVTALKAALDTHGLCAPSAHVSINMLRENFDSTVAKLKALGIGIAIVPAVPETEHEQDLSGWQALGRELRAYARRFADVGLRFAWHNHAFEFVQLTDGSRPLDWILGDDALLLWQFDIGWVARGGQDPIAWIGRYDPRIVSFHVKDIAPPGQSTDEDGWADFGYGVLDWAQLLLSMSDYANTPLCVRA